MPVPELYKYNPRQCSPEELEATFVARQAVLADVLGELRSRAGGPVNQHFLLIGPRGIGKTNLLLMIRYGVLADDALAAAYLPLQTAEEEYSVASLRDLFAKILDLLIEQAPEDDLAAARESVEAARKDDDAAELAISAVRGYRERSGRKILLLVDNVDLILDEQLNDDAQLGRLRDVLMNDSFLVLIGAAPTHFREVSGYDRPFYNFFRTIDLADLSAEQMGEMLRRRAEWDGNRTILDRFEELQPRIRAVHHLTGGNPRLVLMLYQLCTAGELPEVRAAVQALLDDVTPYYKGRLERLPPQQRRVMDTFARLGRPATPSELARETRLPVNQINSTLQRLRDHGFVVLAPQERRKKTYYMVSERVFRIWHQMRFSTTSRRLQFLIDFLRIWYTPQEWQAEADRLLGEYAASARERRFDRTGRLIEHLQYLADAAPQADLGYQMEDKTIRTCIESGDFQHAHDVLEDHLANYEQEGNRDRLAQTWYDTAYLRNAQGRTQDELAALAKAVEFRPEFADALYSWGTALGQVARTKSGVEQEQLLQKACEKFEAALGIKPDKHAALNNWGNALGDLACTKAGSEQEQLFQQAFGKYEAALRIKPDLHEALISWGCALDDVARTKTGAEQEQLFQQAFEKYEGALRIKPDEETALHNWGCTLGSVARTKTGAEQEQLFQAAFDKYEAALQIKPDNCVALSNWGCDLGSFARTKAGAEQERLFQEAFGRYRAALQIKGDMHEALNNWGNDLAGLAGTRTGPEQQGLLQAATDKVVQAIEAAGSVGALERAAYYSAHFVHLALLRSAIAVEQKNAGHARRLFAEALGRMPQARSDLVSEELISFFRAVAREETAELCAELLEAMRVRGLEDELGVLKPVVKAVEYWQKGKDAEVLDRLNPEVRQIVEEIIGRD